MSEFSVTAINDDPVPGVGPRIFGGVPFRNSNFTGREEMLERLHSTLQRREPGMTLLPHALHGLGGVGTTQVAIEYAWRYAQEYDLVWWLRAESATTVRAGLQELSERMGRGPGGRWESSMDALDVLQRRVEYPRWLLVLDDAAAPEELQGLVPAFGHVLVTSRHPGWAEVAVQFEVDRVSRDESIAVKQRSGDATAPPSSEPAWRQFTDAAVGRATLCALAAVDTLLVLWLLLLNEGMNHLAGGFAPERLTEIDLVAILWITRIGTVAGALGLLIEDCRLIWRNIWERGDDGHEDRHES